MEHLGVVENQPTLAINPDLILQIAPPPDPAWLAHEQAANLLSPRPVITDPKANRERYSKSCKDLNTLVLNGRDENLRTGLDIQDTLIPSSQNAHQIPIRIYTPDPQSSSLNRIIVYYHGGGLYVGDLDSEDLTCRRLCKSLSSTVYSVDYRLLPEYTANDALADAIDSLESIITRSKASAKIVLAGSSSGGELAAQVSQYYHLQARSPDVKIQGVLLRGPVVCDATSNGINLPRHLKDLHTSMSPSFHTSILAGAALNAQNRSTAPLPLERPSSDLKGLPKHWIQVCTNDIYYSDGALYAEVLRLARVEVKLDVLKGWPHTFWLKAPLLERAERAEEDAVEGCRWLFEG